MVTGVRRILTVGGVAAALLLGNAVAARADFGDPVNCVADPTNPACVIQIGTPGGPGDGGSSGTAGCHDWKGRAIPCYIPGKGWLGEGNCYFQRATGTDLALAETLGGKLNPPEYWYTGACGDPITNFWPAGLTVLRAYDTAPGITLLAQEAVRQDRKSTRLNSSHVRISYAVFCLKKKKKPTPLHSIKNKNKTKKQTKC